MLSSISITSLLSILISIVVMIFIVISMLNRYEDDRIIKYAATYHITSGAVLLSVIVLNMILSAFGITFASLADSDIALRPIELLVFHISELAIGIIILKSRHGFSVPAFTLTCLWGVISAIDRFADLHIGSMLSFALTISAIAAMVRQFREKKASSNRLSQQ